MTYPRIKWRVFAWWFVRYGDKRKMKIRIRKMIKSQIKSKSKRFITRQPSFS